MCKKEYSFIFAPMRRPKFFAILIVVTTVLMTTFSFYTYQIMRSPNILVEKNDRIFIIHKNQSFDMVRDTLYRYGYIHDIISFSFLSKLMDYTEAIKPGRYLLKRDMNNIEAIRLLRAGNQEPTTITFNIIRLKEDLAEKITSSISIGPSDFLKALENFENSNSRNLDSYTSMTLFIPNTYQVYWTIEAEELIEKMEIEHDKFWSSDREQKALQMGMTPTEVSILASIVQAEARKREEGAIIAGLYINRLEAGMPLQADPTVVYASGEFGLKRVLTVHTQIDSPYNTYMYRGLPPGPINLPEIWAIDAVLNYQGHKFIYMCAKEDFSGNHSFATNLRDHNINASRYQRALSAEQRKARQNAQ